MSERFGGIPLDGLVVAAVERLELRVGEIRPLLGEPFERLLRVARQQEDPAVALHLHRAVADAGGAELVEEADELGRQEHALAAGEVGDPPAAVLERPDLLLQGLVDLRHRLGELLGSGVEQLVDACERHAGVGQDLDAHEVEHGLRVVAPVARGVTRGLRQQAALVVVAHRADGHPDVLGELADGEHRRVAHAARGRLKAARAPA